MDSRTYLINQQPVCLRLDATSGLPVMTRYRVRDVSWQFSSFDGKQSQRARHRLTLVRSEPPRLRDSLTSSLGFRRCAFR
jgi:hypothetical protein